MASLLSARDKKVIWHPYTHQKYAPDPIPIKKGEGSWLIDDEGNRYLDAISSWWVTVHGHAHPYIAEKIYRQALQLEQVIFAGFTHQPAVELAERLLAMLPGNLSKVFYSDNGSTATEVAVKMAIQYWWNQGNQKRTRILALKNGYHGDTFGAMSVSERGMFTLAFRNRLFEVQFVDPPLPGEPLQIDGLTPEQSLKILDESACIIYEPLVQGAGGMKMYTAESLDNLLSQCRQRGILCVADEVMTGFGRTGKMFASSYCTNYPDIICLSKGLTGGTLPLGVTACGQWIQDAFIGDDKMKSFFHGHSFTANPLACAAALASLDIFAEKATADNIDRITTQHATFINRLAVYAEQGAVSQIRQTGTIVAFEIPDTAAGYGSDVRDRFTAGIIQKEVYLRPLGNTVYILPPYCITASELEHVYAAVLDTLNDFMSK